MRACLDRRKSKGIMEESNPMEMFCILVFGMKETSTVKQRKVSYLHSFYGKQNIQSKPMDSRRPRQQEKINKK